jgi:hypothetical protein
LQAGDPERRADSKRRACLNLLNQSSALIERIPTIKEVPVKIVVIPLFPLCVRS